MRGAIGVETVVQVGLDSPWVLCGRSGELKELEGLIAGCLNGVGAVALVEGPPGIGKSRVLEAAGELGSARGLTVARQRADELDQISPWLTLVGALTSSDPPILDREALQGSSERLDQRSAVLEALRESLERVATRRPVMVVLDDLQWADQATVAALGWLPEQLFSYPILWLLARRPLPSSSLLDALVGRLNGLGAQRLALEPLDAAAAFALAAEVAGGPIAVEARDLLSATGGNPLFIVEMSRGFGVTDMQQTHRGAQTQDRSRMAMVAERSLRGVVEAHLRSLSASTVEVLKAASVFGREFTGAELSELTAQPIAQLLPAIAEAITGGVLVEGSGQLAFGHDVFRQLLYSAIPSSLQRSLHGEAAAVLRRRGASPTRLAHQLVIGAEAGDPEAVSSLYQAVGELVGTSPWSAADVALRLVELTPLETDEHTSAVSMAVQLLGWAARTDEARSLGEHFLESVAASPAREAEVLSGMLRAWLSRHVRPYPRPIPGRLLTDTSIPAGVRATLLTFGQIEALIKGSGPEADAALNQAAALLAGSATDLEAISVRSLWALSAQLQGQFVEAVERARRDLKVRPTSEAAGVAVTEATVASCLGALGRVQEGLVTVERATRAAEGTGYSHVSDHCRCLRAAFFLDAGRLDDARAEATVAADAALNAGFLTLVTLALTTLVESSVRAGDFDAADAALERLKREGEGEWVNPDPQWATAMVAEARGRGAMALRALAPVFAALARSNFAIAARHPARLPQLIDLALRHGDEDAARSTSDAVTRLACANQGVTVLEQLALHARGLVDRDVAALQEAHERSKTADTRLLSTILSEHLGLVEAEAGRRPAAVAALEEALASFTEMGAHQDSARVRAGLRKLGVRRQHVAAARPERGWAALTRAELSVARVVSKGLTNREAADELGVSSDTVNTHLRHAFVKLDIQSRRELARLVVTHDR
jgi:DNA-binding CsgD family transcriptional regulator